MNPTPIPAVAQSLQYVWITSPVAVNFTKKAAHTNAKVTATANWMSFVISVIKAILNYFG